MKEIQLNVYGEEIKECSCSRMTGFFRTGCCETSDQDQGSHTVCTAVSYTHLTLPTILLV